MEDDFFDEDRESKARNRAKRFFQMLTERRQKAKEERDKERVRQRREDVLTKMQELQGETGARQQPFQQVLHQAVQPQPQSPPPPEPIVPDPPELTIPEPLKPPSRPVQPDPATVEFLRWCFRQREEEEEPDRYRRFPQIYRKRDGRD